MFKNFILNSSFNHELWLNYLTYEDFEALFNSDKDIKSLFKRFWPQKTKLMKMHNIKYDENYQCFACKDWFKLSLYKFYDLVFLLCKKKGCRDVALQHTKPNFYCPFMIPKSNLWFIMGEHPLLKISEIPVKEIRVFIGNYCGFCFKRLENNITRTYGSIFTISETLVFPVCLHCIQSVKLYSYFKQKSFVFIYHYNQTKCQFFMKSATLTYVEDDDTLIRQPIQISVSMFSSQKTFSHTFKVGYTSTFYYHIEKLQPFLYSGEPIPRIIDFQFMIEPLKPENNFFTKYESTFHEPIEHWEYLQPTLIARNTRQLKSLWEFKMIRTIEVGSSIEETYSFNTQTKTEWHSDIYQLLTIYYLKNSIQTNTNLDYKVVYFSARCPHPDFPVSIITGYRYKIKHNVILPEAPLVTVPYSPEEENLYASEDDFALRTSDSDNDLNTDDGYITQDLSFGD
jgi:hypothetical protein